MLSTPTTPAPATAYTLNDILSSIPWHSDSDHAVVVGIAPDSGMPKPVPATRRVPDGIAAWTDSADGRIWVRTRTVPDAGEAYDLSRWLARPGSALPASATVHGVAAVGVIGHEDAHAVWSPYTARTATNLMLEDLRIEGLAMAKSLLVARPILRACAVTHVFDPTRFTVRTVTEAVTAYLLVAGRVRLGILSDGSEYWLDPTHTEGAAVSDIIDALTEALSPEVTARLDEAIDAYIETDAVSLWTSGRADSYFWTTGQGRELLAAQIATRAEIADGIDALIREVGGNPDRVTDPFHGEHGCQFGPATETPETPEEGEEAVSAPGTPGSDPDAESTDGAPTPGNDPVDADGDGDMPGTTPGDAPDADGDAPSDPTPTPTHGDDPAPAPGDADAPTPVPGPGGDSSGEDPEESREIEASGETTSMIDTSGKADRVFAETTRDDDDAHDDRPIDSDLIEAITDAARDLADALSDPDALDSEERREAAAGGSGDDRTLLDPIETSQKVFGRYGATKRRKLLADFGFGAAPSGHDLLGEFADGAADDSE